MKILLAGATGYLGCYIAKELIKRDYHVKSIVRNTEKLKQNSIEVNEVIQGQLTQPESIIGVCEGIDVVISTVGITRQKDGLTYHQVDYQANKNLLLEAQKSGVKKFIYISVLNGEKLRHLKGCDAKETFVEELKTSGLDYCIIRPNGFFSDMSEFYSMAKKGTIYLFGAGKFKSNPIHGEDLAVVCVDAIKNSDHEINVGGPETLTHNEIAELAFEVIGKGSNIRYIPDFVRKIVLRTVRFFTGSKTYGPIEFFLTVMAMDMVAPEYGKHTLKSHFEKIHTS